MTYRVTSVLPPRDVSNFVYSETPNEAWEFAVRAAGSYRRFDSDAGNGLDEATRVNGVDGANG
jgi:hypothetical protein